MTKRIISFILILSLSLVPLQVSSVEAKSKKMKINYKKTTAWVGESFKLKIKNAKKKVKWSSSNKKIATVSKKGKVKPIKVGKTTIKGRVGKKTFKCKLTVIPNPDNIVYSYSNCWVYTYSDRYECIFSLDNVWFSKRLRASGTFDALITNNSGEVVYKKNIPFTSANYSTRIVDSKSITNICTIIIPKSSIKKGKNKNGKFSFKIKVTNGKTFNDYVTLSDLPTEEDMTLAEKVDKLFKEKGTHVTDKEYGDAYRLQITDGDYTTIMTYGNDLYNMKMLTMYKDTDLVQLRFDIGSSYAPFDYITGEYQAEGFVKKDSIDKNNITFTSSNSPYIDVFKGSCAGLIGIGLRQCRQIFTSGPYGITGMSHWGFKGY